MRKSLALLAFLFIQSSLLFGQDVSNTGTNSTPPIIKQARDFIMLDFNYSNWLNKPDSVKTKTLGFGFNVAVCYDFPIKHTNLSFAAGVGINTQVVYFDKQTVNSTDTSSTNAQARIITDSAGSKRDKFVVTYVQAPFELRYFADKINRNKGFKAAIGLEVGTLLNSHTKNTVKVDGTNVSEKIDTKRFVSPWNFAATARIGWGNFSLFASYNLTTVFRQNQGPPATPFSLGLCLTGL
jgi:hypothetical protein